MLSKKTRKVGKRKSRRRRQKSVIDKSTFRSSLDIKGVNESASWQQNKVPLVAVGPIAHSDFKDGCRYKGTEVITNIAVINASYAVFYNDLFDSYTAPPLAGLYYMNPSLLFQQSGGAIRLYTQALMYTRYVYRKVRFIYEPAVATTTNGQMTMGVSPSTILDSDVNTDSALWYFSASEMVPSLATPYYSPATLEYSYDGPQTWALSNEQDGLAFQIGDANNQMTFVASALGKFITSYTIMGTLRLEYTIDFFGGVSPLLSNPYPSLTAALSRESRLQVHALIRELSLKDEASKKTRRELREPLETKEREKEKESKDSILSLLPRPKLVRS